ncbi:MAG TPA: hypothetical protein VKU02_02595 [Gemmataceae bacterium]|nr:hypothetical protein [Gemmataceae bacterium]
MKTTLTGLGALVLALAFTNAAPAWFEYNPPQCNAFTPMGCCYPCWNMYSCGSYSNWPPCCQPFQGLQAPPPSMGNDCIYRFARSPRDYFMVDP